MRSNRFLILCILLAVLFLTHCGSDTGQSADGDIEYDGESDSVDAVDSADGDIEYDGESDSADGDFDGVENGDVEISSTFGSITGMALLRNSDDNSGINVLLLLDDTVIQQLETDFEGDYEFSEIDPGNYTITASWGDFTVERVVQTEVNVLANSNALAADLMLTPTGNLDGQVTLDGVAAGILGVQIYIPGHSYVARSDDDGNYLFSHIPVGVYQLCAEMTGFGRECLNTITVLAGETVDVDVIDLEISDVANPLYASLSGNVTLLGEDDHSQISVSLAGTAYATTTDANGNFILLNIPQGVYDIVFDAPAGSGFESGATLYDYRLFAGIHDDTLPDMELHFGRNFVESDSDTLQGSVNDDLGLVLLVFASKLILYNKETGDFSVLAEDALNSTGAYSVNSDWTEVVYTTKSYDLYSISITGGTAVLLGNDVSDYEISPDWTKVVYRTKPYDLYSIPIAGGTAVLLGSDVESYQISPDLTQVIYKIYSIIPSGYILDLYSIPITGGTAVLLGSDVGSYEISSDSTIIVYRTSYFTYNLYSIPIAGGTAVLLGSEVYMSEISPDWTTVVYRTSSSYNSNLYSIPIEGGTAILLGSKVHSYEISPDWTTVVYRTSSSYDSNLYSIPIEGGTATLFGSDVSSYAISPDWTTVLYITYSSYEYHLYSIPIAGGTAVLLGNDVESYEVSPDWTTVVYRTSPYYYDLYSIPITGGTAVLLGSSVSLHKTSPDWTYLVFSQGSALWRVSITGEYKQVIASAKAYFSAFDDFNSVFYTRKFGADTTYYSENTYRFNLAEFD